MEKTLYFPPVDEMPIMEEIRIREKDPSQGNNTQQASYKIQQDVTNKGVRAGELENLSKFTEKVGDFCLCRRTPSKPSFATKNISGRSTKKAKAGDHKGEGS